MRPPPITPCFVSDSGPSTGIVARTPIIQITDSSSKRQRGACLPIEPRLAALRRQRLERFAMAHRGFEPLTKSPHRLNPAVDL